MQRIHKPTVYRLYSFLERISCRISDYLPYRKKVHRIKPAELLRSPHRGHHLWAMMRPLPNSGPKSHSCRIESRHTRVRDGILPEHRNKLVVDGPFREARESQKKNNTSLLHLVHSDGLKYVDSFVFFLTLLFKDLLFGFLSLTLMG
jgi:hypothetical protein